jgi:SNF2 family DNA or RNA helicase
MRGTRSAELNVVIPTSSCDLSLAVVPLTTRFADALDQSPPIAALTHPLDPAPQPPQVITLKVHRAPPRIFSFTFPEAPTIPPSPASPPRADSRLLTPDPRSPLGRGSADPARPATRIKPPGDIIKLQDRLYYVLQPPLESLLAQGDLHFPFEPFPYQYQGVAFLYPRYAAILADEMGLGKTMQSITAIRMLLRSGELRSVLLVCPKPLVTNWRREFWLWAPEIPLTIIEGDAAKRRWQWTQESAPVKIANYELLMRDREVLGELAPLDLVMLDEAQRVKNSASATSQVVRSIRRARNWALTGTPIENSPDDLVGIFEFLAPGYLRPGTPPRRLAELVRDYILRRTKEMVLADLPPKLFREAELDLSPEQRASYELAENDGVMRLNQLGDEITIQHVFELVLRLKQICNFDPATGASSKLERLEADLEEVAASGKKAIVFSQWVKCLEILSHQLRRFGPLQYHGKVPSKQRDAVLKQFQDDKSRHVILMSYGAGSVGLNLQFCEYVFLFDRWWNPAVEDQAINRAHRIGVTGPVTVTRMLALATIEERINQILEHKRELFDQIISQTAAPASLGLSQSEIFGLFNLRTPKGAIKPAA